ncbi:MAG: hypothetical protein KDC46_10640 [Thermoleophilia bacterium]|nr:hypothetical protein [Thermoleophilia bacterium]
MAMPVGIQRVIAGAAIVPASALALPLTAAFLDTKVDENLLLPIAAGGTLAVGAGIGAALPHAFTATGSHLRGAAIGAGAALGVAALSTAALFWAIGDH